MSTWIAIIKFGGTMQQARGDIGFLWADTGDDMAKTMKYYINPTAIKIVLARLWDNIFICVIT